MCYYRIPDALRKKLDPKAKIGFYLGIEPTSKAARVLVRTPDGKLAVKSARDVICVERYMIHPNVPAVQSYEHVEAPASGQTLEGTPMTGSGVISPWGGTPSIDLPRKAHPRLYAGEDLGEGHNGLEGSGSALEPADAPCPSGTAAQLETDIRAGGVSEEDVPDLGDVVDDPVMEIDSGGDAVLEDYESDDDMQWFNPQQWVQQEYAGNYPQPDSKNGSRYPVRSTRGRKPDWFVPEFVQRKKARRTEPFSVAVATAEQVADSCAHARAVTEVYEPGSFKAAMACPQAERWREATDDEYKSLLENNTWELVPRQPGMKVIPSKWVLKIKKDAEGNPVRYKARLVAGGHRQEFGVDYEETFAPVSKHTTIRVFLSVASKHKMAVKQMDIKTAFLHGEITEHEVYMNQPEGYEQGTNMVCKLTKCLYGLKQAPRAWNKKLTERLMEMGFKPSIADPSLWVGHSYGEKTFITIVVDDMLLASKSMDVVDKVIKDIGDVFESSTTDPQWYIGMKLNWQADGSVIVTQKSHIEKMLAKHGLENVPYRTLPAVDASIFTKEGTPLDTTKFHYSSLVGALLYISTVSRPDIACVVNRLAKFMSCPTEELWKVALNLCGYLKYTIDYGVHLGKGESCVMYCDADFASDIDKRRSHTGWVFMLYGTAVCWQSKCQPTVAVSTTEAEYQSVSMATREALWLQQLLPEFGIDVSQLTIFCDSMGALKSLKNPQITQRTKHIDVMHHFVRERVADGLVRLEFVPGEYNVADIFTKPLPGPKFRRLREQMGVVKLST
jgi:hypothetical protein